MGRIPGDVARDRQAFFRSRAIRGLPVEQQQARWQAHNAERYRGRLRRMRGQPREREQSERAREADRLREALQRRQQAILNLAPGNRPNARA